ncbi:MAG: zinc-binding dehydrogenase [Acidobacteria bacterium]|nr:zinc-binding dehydrogenase [Acidobacteriota bacterium]
MRAVFAKRYGPPEVLELRELPDPTPHEGQMRVRVAASGINFADLLMRLGLYPGTPKPPFIPGLELAGTIEAVGAGVAASRIGERVLTMMHTGAYADQVVIPAERAVPIPPAMSFAEAAALPVNYLTAYHALIHMAGLRAGERVLIHAAAGGVGLAALELCKLRGAETFGTASAAKHDFLRARGLDHPIDYQTQDFEAKVQRLTARRGVDVVLDAVGGESFRKSYRLLAPAGRLIVFGLSQAVRGRRRSLASLWALLKTPRFHAMNLMRHNRAVVGVHLGALGRTNPALIKEQLGELFRLHAEGKIKPYVGKTFPLAEAAAAHRFLHDRQNLGKVLLVP